MEPLIGVSTESPFDPSADVSRSVHADQLAMARLDLRWGLAALVGLVVLAWLWPEPVVLLNLALPGLFAVNFAVRSFIQLRRLQRTDPAISLALEHARAVQESAELAAHRTKMAAITPVVTFALAGAVVAVTLIEWWIGTARRRVVAAPVGVVSSYQFVAPDGQSGRAHPARRVCRNL
jgi:hypothetical protein